MRKILVLTLLVLPGYLFAQVNVNQGLVAYYPFSGNANEITGNGVNGIAQNGTALTTDRFGNANSAYYFDGVDDFIQIPSNATLNPTSAFTIALYFNPEQNSVQTLIGKISYFGGVGTQYQIAINFPPQPGVLFGTNPIANSCAGVPLNGQYVNTGAGTITNGQWHCVVATFENGVMKIYLNGVLVQTTTASFNIMNICSNADVQIGSWWTGDQQRFKGKIDDVRFYDRAINAQEVAALCNQTTPLPCNAWLHTPTQPSWVNIGDLDVPGNQLTVEALINIKGIPPGGVIQGLDVVSKHTGPPNVNYLLRSTHAELTTTNGFYSTPEACDIEMNKTYHVAMVYNGISLKYYRNGFLVSEIPASGNMIQNDLPTGIGFISTLIQAEQFIGFINNVRIWNVARSQSQIKTYMNSILPSPPTQTGLLAYYTFDNLINKQGNAAFNGILNGAAAINQVNPNCNFNADSCVAPTNSVSSIINDYSAILSLDICKNIINVEDAARYNIGDTVMIIQMKGATVNTSNSAAFGSIINYNEAGNYEFNYIKAKVGNSIELKNTLINNYNPSEGKVQLIRVPYYLSIKNDATLTCLPWDGSKGGVLVFNVRDTFTMQANINVNGRGFRGGNSPNNGLSANSCNQNNFSYPVGSPNAAAKGEGIVSTVVNPSWGKGAEANAGGGGNGHNAGGGGGSNFGQGGFGGYQLLTCGNSPFDNRGVGGYPLSYNNVQNKIFLGGGGGSGHANNSGGSAMPGGNGGGIVIINSGFIQSNGYKILANGSDALQCTLSSFADCYDAGGGGGAGGTVLIKNSTYLSPVEIQANAGKGGDVIIYDPAANKDKIGPGGGGGGGVVWLNNVNLPPTVTARTLRGNNGKISLDGNNPWGANSGTDGNIIFNLSLPITTTPFKPNIDSVRFSQVPAICRTFDFNGLGFTNTHPIASWNWTFGDAGSAITQNTSHTYADDGTYTVKLIVTDINGCKDSLTKNIVVSCASDTIIVNDYTPVISLDICKNIINVEDASAFNVGDTVLMIQMKGAVIDSTNTAAFGSITDYKNAGNYEFNYVKSKSGNSIELLNVLLRQYDLPGGKVQLIRVPYYTNANFDKVLTCLPWDGSKGGVLVINVQDTLTLGANMDVSGRGFRGGIDPFSNPGSTVYNCYENNFFYPVNPDLASGKGEGIALISAAKSFGKGALANGGGGGNSHNSGGGGGSNGSLGGFGGYSFEGSPCNGTVPFNNRGIGGYQLPYNNAQNKIFLGGGGGAGHSNNPEAFEAEGGNGAGIIIITADKIKANTNKIIANGNAAIECGTNTGGCHEGMGGGGAAGTVLLNINTFLDNMTTEVIGGKGADMTSAGNLKLGPGGGGSGGITWFKQTVSPANLFIIYSGGGSGLCTGYANDPWGATSGTFGDYLGNLVVPITTTPFKPNIDSVRFSSSPTTCSAFNFNGLSYTNNQGIASWQWYFGDGGTATTQNTSHTYATSGTFNVKLVITDINGCKDSISRPVNTNTLNVSAGNDASYCSNTAVSHTLSGSGAGTIYNWQPAALLNDNSLANPVATITSTTKFYLTHSDALGCSAVDSVVITINPVPVITTIGDTAFCSNTNLTLSATGASSYIWSPPAAVDNPTIANPVFIGTTDQTMTVTGTNVEGCSANGSFDVTVKTAPVVSSIRDSILCGPQAIVLTTSGAQTYSWSPATGLSDAGIANPVFTGTTGNYNYTVTGTAANGCTASDIVNVTVNPVPIVNSFGDTAVCSNRNLQLLATGAASYVWSPAAAVSNPNISNPVFTATGNQTITVTGSNAQGCSDTHSFNVSYNIAPVIATIPDSTICNTQSIVLTTTGAQTYSWSPAINLSNSTIASPVFSGSTGNTYTVTGTDANGCSDTDVVIISTRAPGVFNTPPDKSVCINGSVILDGNNGNGVSYQWSPAATLSNTNTINPTATPPVAGNNVYTLLVAETVCNSSRTFQVNVLAHPLPNVTASRSNDLDCAIRSTGLTASGAVSYTWTPAATLNNAAIANPVASPTTNTTYIVIGTDANGCKDDGTVTVLVKETEGRFDIPNAFTPNGDGKNDCFGVRHWGDATVFHFMIFNRWGEKVFETKDIHTCWDGRYKGQPADIGNYVYYIKSVNFCGEQVKKGNVILIR